MHATATIDMVDSISSPATTGQPIPQAILDAAAVAAYIAGNSWPTWDPYIAARPDLLPAGRAVSITLTARARARCFDIETGGGSPAEAPGWYHDFADRTFGLPILYTYASQVQTVINMMSAAGIPRSDYLLWSAHPSGGRHICGPNAYGPGHGCGYPQADGTQYGTLAGNCDISLMYAYCFTPLPNPPNTEDNMLACGLNAQGAFHVFRENPDGSIDYGIQAPGANGWSGGVAGQHVAELKPFAPKPGS
jgi:hypothetical protein